MKVQAWLGRFLLSSAVLLPLVNACGQESNASKASSIDASAAAGLGEWYAYAPTMVTAGKELSISVSTDFPGRQDVLVDLLDAKGWYIGTRATFEAGQQWNQLKIKLPEIVKDPASVYVAVKILPVGANWDKYLDEKILPLQWPVSTPIKAPLYFGGSLKSWNYPFVSPVGNHGSRTVEVGIAKATDPYRVGPFEGSYVIQSFADNYGLFKTNYGLNLQTGEVYTTSIEANHTPPSITTKRLAVPKNQTEFKAYLEILDGLIQAVRANASFNQGVEWSQLKEAEAYLGRASASFFAKYGETLRLPYESGETRRLFTNAPNSLSFAYGAATARDLLLDLIVDGRWVTGLRLPIVEGSNMVTPELQIPSWVPPMTKGILSAKIVPRGQPWNTKTAELNQNVLILGVNRIEWVNTPDIDKVHAGSVLTVSGNYSGDQVLDVLADLVDTHNKWIAGARVTGALSYPGSPNYYEFSIDVKVPAHLKPGQQVKLFTKLIPVGGSWTQAVDENALTLTVE